MNRVESLHGFTSVGHAEVGKFFDEEMPEEMSGTYRKEHVEPASIFV